MNTYHKIHTVYKRDPKTNYKTLLEGEYSTPEIEYLKDNKWVFTEKIDGMNIRIKYEDGMIFIAGKTDKAKIPSGLMEWFYKHMMVKTLMFESIFDTDVCLYGEGFGGKIQKGSKYGTAQRFILFDVKVGKVWLRRPDVEKISIAIDVPLVPEIGSGTLDDMVKLAKQGFNSIFGEFPAEGIVARPFVEMKSRMGERIITKIKLTDFRG